jgi:hypothetical protein
VWYETPVTEQLVALDQRGLVYVWIDRPYFDLHRQLDAHESSLRLDAQPTALARIEPDGGGATLVGFADGSIAVLADFSDELQVLGASTGSPVRMLAPLRATGDLIAVLDDEGVSLWRADGDRLRLQICDLASLRPRELPRSTHAGVRLTWQRDAETVATAGAPASDLPVQVDHGAAIEQLLQSFTTPRR